jgi:hypothetical protein
MDRHEEDRAFLEELREIGERTLKVLLQFQACEAWKRIAIEREITRRTIPGSSNRQDTRL